MPRTLKIDVPLLFRLHAAGLPEKGICDALGIGRGSFYALRKRHGLPAIDRRREKPAEVDPTPEEIAERAAEVRRRWSARDHERRRVGKSARPTLRNYRFSVTDFAMTPAPLP